MDLIQSNGNAPPHRYEGAGTESQTAGYYEPGADVHLYDLLNDDFASELDEIEAQDRDDQLVASAAWLMTSKQAGVVTDWLSRLRMRPGAWLTPWRQGEPSIPAALWLDPSVKLSADLTFDTYVVVRLDNCYHAGMPLRRSLDDAVDRFVDLRRAVEQSMEEELGFRLERATRAWLNSLAGPDDEDVDEGEDTDDE